MNSTPRFLIKTEATRKVGLGHIRRQLKLAEGLRNKGAEVIFAVSSPSALTESIPFPMKHVIEPSEFQTYSRECNAVILDEPELPEDWFDAFDSFGLKIGIDEMGPARDHLDIHICTTLLGLENRQECRGKTKEFIGPKYFLFPEDDPVESLKREEGRILVSMGGTDPRELGMEFFEGLERHFPTRANYDWVATIGPGYPKEYALRLKRKFPKVSWLEDQKSMSHLYLTCEAIVCCGGITPYEALKQGCLPLLLAQIQEQAHTASTLHNAGLGIQFGDSYTLNWDQFNAVFKQDCESLRARAAQQFQLLLEGNPTQRVVDILMDHAKSTSL
ncbi:hypothetical protein HOF92_05955 [bacterium]|jgi:spore coat polysaccharide biosynthesis predicted glycosyltransferase SpsG|nr:hypothetical protein [bacterium]